METMAEVPWRVRATARQTGAALHASDRVEHVCQRCGCKITRTLSLTAFLPGLRCQKGKNPCPATKIAKIEMRPLPQSHAAYAWGRCETSQGVSRGRRFCHLRQTYFVTRASWRDAWRDAAKVDLASHLKAPHWGTLQTSSISRLPRRSREPGSPTAELLQAGSSLQSRRDQATRPPRAPYAVSGHLLARTAHFRGGSRKQPAAAVADQARAAVRHGLVAVTAPGIARAASLWCRVALSWPSVA